MQIIIEQTPPRSGQWAIYEWPSGKALATQVSDRHFAKTLELVAPNAEIRSTDRKCPRCGEKFVCPIGLTVEICRRST